MVDLVQAAKLVFLEAEGGGPLEVCQAVVLEWVLLRVVRIEAQGLILIREKVMGGPVGLPVKRGLHLLQDTAVSAASRAFGVDAIELPVAILREVRQVLAAADLRSAE